MSKSGVESRLIQSPTLLDQVHETMQLANYPVKRLGELEMLVDVPAAISQYPIYIYHNPEQSAFMQSALLDLVADRSNVEIYKLLALINAQLMYGHFDLHPEHDTLMFRHTQMVPDDLDFAKSMVDCFLDEAIDQCERYFAAFLLVIRDGMQADDAIEQGAKAIDGWA